MPNVFILATRDDKRGHLTGPHVHATAASNYLPDGKRRVLAICFDGHELRIVRRPSKPWTFSLTTPGDHAFIDLLPGTPAKVAVEVVTTTPGPTMTRASFIV